ncbi:mutator type transposase [Tanacetum coccineum]
MEWVILLCDQIGPTSNVKPKSISKKRKWQNLWESYAWSLGYASVQVGNEDTGSSTLKDAHTIVYIRLVSNAQQLFLSMCSELKMAYERVVGSYSQQYAQLRDYCMELKEKNPNTTVKIEVEPPEDPDSEERKFKRIYICLGPLKDGFKAGGRDFLGLDGCFLSGPYPGQILTAVGVDPNNGIYPLAYAVVESESKDSWKWFLDCLGDDLELFRNSNFTFISDRQKGVIPAIAENFPNAEHRFCLKHIYDNMKLSWRGKFYKEMLWKCATASTIQKQLLDGRDKPIITCLEYIREYLMKRIVNVQKVEWNGSDLYQVTCPWGDQFVVNLSERVCSCRKWELSGIPCTHAVASIWDQANNGIDTGIPESYCLPVHWLTTWKEMYKFKINPVNGPQGWKKSDVPTTIIPPKPHPQIGRPPKKRKKSAAELADEMMKSKKLTKTGKSVTCKSCKQVGHNSRGCKSKKGGGSQQAGVAGHGDAAHGSQQAGVHGSQTTQSTPQAS